MLLVVVGVAFVITAFAFFTMTLRAAQAAGESSLFMDAVAEHGMQAMIVELVVLAIATFGAMATDDYWTRRNTAASSRDEDQNQNQKKSPAEESAS